MAPAQAPTGLCPKCGLSDEWRGPFYIEAGGGPTLSESTWHAVLGWFCARCNYKRFTPTADAAEDAAHVD